MVVCNLTRAQTPSYTDHTYPGGQHANALPLGVDDSNCSRPGFFQPEQRRSPSVFVSGKW